MDKRPNLFIVGAPRCGTSALHVQLAQHGRVFMSQPKERHFFCGDIHRAFEQHQGVVTDPLFRTEEQYLRLFEGAGAAPVRGESSVYYLYSDEAPSRIAAFAPDARVVIMLREPIDFMCSLHAKLRWTGNEDCVSFERPLELEPSRRRGQHLPPTVRFPALVYYRRYAAFSRWIEAFGRHFDSQQIKVVLLNDHQNDAEGVFHPVLDHVGVERIPLPPREDRNANVEPRFEFISRYLFKRGARKQGRVRRLLLRYNTRLAKRRPVTPAVLAALHEEFLPAVERLSERLGRDLVTAWGYAGSRVHSG